MENLTEGVASIAFAPDSYSSTADGPPPEIITQAGFLHAFIASLTMITLSELGDKTFFIAAILAMKSSRLLVFIASMLALSIMTVLASVLGIASTVIPKAYIHYTSIVLFVVFGIKMLFEGFSMSSNEAEAELNQVERELEKRGGSNKSVQVDPESGSLHSLPSVTIRTGIRQKFQGFLSLVFFQTFTMIFIAEWGDRSQISTMVLAARENAYAVTLGALLGHTLCTGLAVVGGRFIAQVISVKTVTILGGIVFILFASVAAYLGE